MKRAIILLSIVTSFGCTQYKSVDKITQTLLTNPIVISSDDITIQGDTGAFTIARKLEVLEEGLQVITFTFSSPAPAELQPINLNFSFPSIDIAGYWNPRITVDKINYWGSGFTSKASRNAPVLTYYGNGMQNRLTIALSDALNRIDLGSYLKEEDVQFHPSIQLFKEKMPKTTSYSIQLRIDTRPLPYYEAIDQVAGWWASIADYKPMSVPDNAKRPMYSTWYSYHQNVSHEAIVAECKIAKKIGCKAVIVDDGWQTLDSNRGYAFVGDWDPVRIGDMKAFVDAVHAEGMQFILWYSLPFMGENARNFEKFKGKYLRYWESQGTYVLDPRYPEVREYILSIFEKAIQDWDLDGFKIDFIGRFTADENTVLTAENGRDFASVNEATDVLMTDLTRHLSKIKPDILIEFRQPYIGPLMRKYGNMFRGVDAPNNAVVNRINTTNLRIMEQNTAVHSDMFIWRPEEPVEQAALQILNILYSVPQLSVRLAEVPKEHLEMIKYWFDYWNNHRDVLLDGKFIPSNPGANYPQLTALKDGHQITTVYDEVVANQLIGSHYLDVINAKPSQQVALRLVLGGNVEMKITDCRGKLISKKNVMVERGLNEFKVPASGLLSLHFIDLQSDLAE